MAVSAEKIEQNVLEDLIAQREASKLPNEDVLVDLESQRQIRVGDYPENTVPGAAQAAIGAVENLAQMMTGFAAAVPGTVRGATWAILAPEAEKGDAYTAGFAEGASPERWYTYEPKTKKGKRYEAAIADTYNEYIVEKWGNHVGSLVDQGLISPAEGAYYRTSADALLLGLFMKGGKLVAGEYAARLGARVGSTRANRSPVDLDAATDTYKPGTGQLTEVGGKPKLLEAPPLKPLAPRSAQKRLPAPEQVEVAVAVRQALDGVEPDGDVFTAKHGDRSPTNPKAIFKNRQAGAVDPEVFAEVATKVVRPAVVTAKAAADLSHALARQIAFKHVTDIRKINSPTAKMLADRIMPLETSTIELGAGFHERISLAEGEYHSRIENILEPLRRHVINKNAAKSLRLVALPKRVNNDIFTALDTGKAPAYIVPAARALRGLLDDILVYQQGAGVEVARRPNYMQHLWDAKKISRAEFGRKNGGAFTQYLVDKEGLDYNTAQEIISLITHEEGFLDFVEDTGGRLAKGQDYSEWSGRVRQVGGGQSRPGYTQKRSLNGSFPESKEWLVTDVESILTSYVNRAARHAEYTRIAGANEAKLNQNVRQIIEEQQLHRQAGGKLTASSPHQTAQEIYDVFDAMQGRFHQIKSPVVRRTSRAIAGYEVISKLSLVALAQFPETMMPAARYRVATSFESLPGIPIPLKSYGVGMVDSAINGMSAAASILTGKRLIPKTEKRKHLERIGVSFVSSLQSSASRMAGPTGVITSRVIRAFMMEAITNLQRTISLDTIQSMIRENARYLAKGLAQGTKARMYRQELTELGINPDLAVEWYRAGMPKDHPVAQKFDIAYVRGIKTNIIMPEAANAPRLYNDPRFQLPFIFTRFFTVFGNTVLKNLGKKLASGDVTNTRKLAMIGSLVTAVGIAYYTQFLREDISGYQYREEDDPLRIVDAVDRSGLTAMFTRLYPLFSAYKYGQGSKYLAGIAFGPAGSDVAGFIEAAKGSNEQRARWMAKMTPIMTITPESEDLMYDFYLEMIDGLPEGH